MSEYRFALLTIASTFLLLMVGGTVNPTGSSLACPEPTLICNGELFPEMVGGVFYEHGHRLVAMTVGLFQIILTVLVWRSRPQLRLAAVGALLMVCFQGVLGALTVKYQLPWAVSLAHLGTAMAYLAVLSWLAWKTRPQSFSQRSARPALGETRRWIAVAAVFVFAQILLGGLVRHHEAALASLDLPLHHGSLWPAGPLALKLHMAHRMGGVVVALVSILCAVAVLRKARGWPTLRLLAVSAIGLVLIQVGLGVYTIMSFRAVPVAVAHFGVAATLWATWFAMWLVSGQSAAAPRTGGSRLGGLGEARG